jgi:hypothetical protein
VVPPKAKIIKKKTQLAHESADKANKRDNIIKTYFPIRSITPTSLVFTHWQQQQPSTLPSAALILSAVERERRPIKTQLKIWGPIDHPLKKSALWLSPAGAAVHRSHIFFLVFSRAVFACKYEFVEPIFCSAFTLGRWG